MAQKNLIIDVGANYGGFSLEIAMRNPACHVLAIEAEPFLAESLKKNAISLDLDNHEVVNFAVNEAEGEFDFYVSELGDHGTSSLLPFSNTNINEDEYWKGRTDLYHSKKFKVKAKPLEKILDNYHFDNIKFIKIDVQGLDVSVLKSAGKYLNKIHSGMLEVPSVLTKSLYDHTEEDLLAALIYLRDNNFSVYAIKPNDPASNEFNVFFIQNGLSLKEIESELNLTNFHFYDGKHFWHAPSHKLENPEQHILNLNDVMKQKDIVIKDLNHALYSTKQELVDSINELAYIRNKLSFKILKAIKLIK